MTDPSTEVPHPFASATDLEAALERLGHCEFRAGQRQAIETLLSRDRLLLVAPTGGGKSLIYQLPSLVLPGTALVISPLISLMADQVEALEERGIAATYLAATLDPDELRGRMSAIARGKFDLVYAAPERLAFAGFRAMLKGLDCPLIAIDEAHCISEWGHDFRPEYLEIGKLLGDFPQSRVLACTATATPVVRDEILERLGAPRRDSRSSSTALRAPIFRCGFAKSSRNASASAASMRPSKKRSALPVRTAARRSSTARRERLRRFSPTA